MRIYLTVVGATLLLLATACPKPPPRADGTCMSTKDCGGPSAATAFCMSGQCVACRGDTDCSVDQTCIEGRCEAATACACGDLEHCVSGHCVAMECTGSYDCPFGSLCDGGVCVNASDVVDPPVTELAAAKVVLPEGCGAVASGGVLDLSAVHFDLDVADLSEESREVLAQTAECLIAVGSVDVRIEGHADERGTSEYNLALGDRRARAVATYLYHLGVPGERLVVVSKGEEEPVCGETSEDCWAQNRRVELLPTLGVEGVEHAALED